MSIPLRAFAAAVSALALLASPAAADSPRDQQWQYFETNGSGQPVATAIFLSWDYSDVLFVASCDPATATLKVRHPAYWPLVTAVNPDNRQPVFDRVLPMALERGQRRVAGRMHLENGDSELVGVFAVDDALLALLADTVAGELMIDVENETGDPWFAGRAVPLLRLAQGCRDAQR